MHFFNAVRTQFLVEAEKCTFFKRFPHIVASSPLADIRFYASGKYIPVCVRKAFKKSALLGFHRLPNCPIKSYSLAVLKNLLTTVGGLPFTNQLFSLTVSCTSKPWTEVYPPMPSKRQWTTTLSIDTILLVAGGVEEDVLITP